MTRDNRLIHCIFLALQEIRKSRSTLKKKKIKSLNFGHFSLPRSIQGCWPLTAKAATRTCSRTRLGAVVLWGFLCLLLFCGFCLLLLLFCGVFFVCCCCWVFLGGFFYGWGGGVGFCKINVKYYKYGVAL